MTELPDPLTPPDCDLRDFAFMPLDVRRLLTSETWLISTGDEKSAALTLWLESWHQIPAASLPNNDRMLSILSQAGAKWKRVRGGALRHWIECADGRLYHPVVAEKALEAWRRKLAQRERGRRGNEARWGKNISDGPVVSSGVEASEGRPKSGGTGLERNAVATLEGSQTQSFGDQTAIQDASLKDSHKDRKGQGQGQGQGQKEVPLAKANGNSPPQKLEKPSDAWQPIYADAKALCGTTSGGHIVSLLRKLLDERPRKVQAKLDDARETRNPTEWLYAFIHKAKDDGKLSGEYIGGVPP